MKYMLDSILPVNSILDSILSFAFLFLSSCLPVVIYGYNAYDFKNIRWSKNCALLSSIDL